MRRFSIVFRDRKTDQLHSAIISHELLIEWMNGNWFEDYKVCCVRELL